MTIYAVTTTVSLLVSSFAAQGFCGSNAKRRAPGAGQGTTRHQQLTMRGEDETLLPVKHMIGLAVVTEQFAVLGTLEDIRVDSATMVGYAVVSRSPAGRDVAVPMWKLKKRTNREYLTLPGVDQKQFLRAPALPQNEWPTHPDMHFWEGIGAALQQRKQVESMRPQPYGPAGPPARLGGAPALPFRWMEDMKLKDQQGNDIGTVQRIYIDMREGRVVYGLMSFRNVEALTNKMALVPWECLKLARKERAVLLQTSLSTVQAVAFTERNVPRLSPQYLKHIAKQFDTKPYWEAYRYRQPPQAAPTEIQWSDG